MIYDYGNEAELTAEDVRTSTEVDPMYLKNGPHLTEVERRAALAAYDEKLLMRDQLYQQRLLQQQMHALRQGANTN